MWQLTCEVWRLWVTMCMRLNLISGAQFKSCFLGGGHNLWVLPKVSCGSKKILGKLTEEVVSEIANDSDSDISFV